MTIDVFVFVFIILCIIALIYGIIYNADKIDRLFMCIILCLLSGLFGWMISYDGSPKGIDVYRGNAVLKIGYVDGIPQDSVVVWKNNVK